MLTRAETINTPPHAWLCKQKATGEEPTPPLCKWHLVPPGQRRCGWFAPAAFCEQTMTHNPDCTVHRETYADGSPRGKDYPDDRTVLAGVYDGLSLLAMLYDEGEVEAYRQSVYDVVLTPAGECRVDGRCRAEHQTVKP